MRLQRLIVSTLTTFIKTYVWLRLYYFRLDDAEKTMGGLNLGLEILIFLLIIVAVSRGDAKNKQNERNMTHQLEDFEKIFKNCLSPAGIIVMDGEEILFHNNDVKEIFDVNENKSLQEILTFVRVIRYN